MELSPDKDYKRKHHKTTIKKEYVSHKLELQNLSLTYNHKK